MRNIKFSIKLSIYISIICSSLMGTAQDLRIQIQEFKNRASVWSKNPTSYTPSGNLKSLLLGCIIPNSQGLKQNKTKTVYIQSVTIWIKPNRNPESNSGVGITLRTTLSLLSSEITKKTPQSLLRVASLVTDLPQRLPHHHAHGQACDV